MLRQREGQLTGGGVGGAHFLELPIVRSRRDPAGGPPGLRFPNQVVDTPSRTQKCVESNSRGSAAPAAPRGT